MTGIYLCIYWGGWKILLWFVWTITKQYMQLINKIITCCYKVTGFVTKHFFFHTDSIFLIYLLAILWSLGYSFLRSKQKKKKCCLLPARPKYTIWDLCASQLAPFQLKTFPSTVHLAHWKSCYAFFFSTKFRLCWDKKTLKVKEIFYIF